MVLAMIKSFGKEVGISIGLCDVPEEHDPSLEMDPQFDVPVKVLSSEVKVLKFQR